MKIWKHCFLRSQCLILLLVLFVFDSAWSAGVFRITNRTYGNISGNASLTAQIDQVFDSMETEVNASLTQFDASTYLTGTANATALATVGGTHDLAHRFNYLYLEVGGGLAADVGGMGPQKLMSQSDPIKSVEGLSGAINMTIGATGSLLRIPKMGSLEPERLKLYLSVAQFSRSMQDVSFDYASYGLMGQYNWIGEQSVFFGSLKWNGVDITTGVKYSKIKVLFSKTFSETLQQDISDPSLGGTQTLTMTYSSQSQLGANANITTIPIEITTGVRFLYLLDTYVGLGTDINFGSADSIISSPGTVSAQEASGAAGTMGGDIEFDLGQQGKPQAFNTRYLIGLGYDLRVFSLMMQYNRNMSNTAESIHFGIAAHF